MDLDSFLISLYVLVGDWWQANHPQWPRFRSERDFCRFARAHLRGYFPNLCTQGPTQPALPITASFLVVGLEIKREVLVGQLEHTLNPWVVFGIMPLFALANAGLPLGGKAVGGLGDPVALGILAASLISGLIGWTLLRRAVSPHQPG